LKTIESGENPLFFGQSSVARRSPEDGIEPSFDALLNETFGRLETKRNQGALRRILRIEETLRGLEDELTVLIQENGASVKT